VLRGPRDFVVEEVDRPTVGAGEVIVRVAACGVCASELEPWVEGPGSEPRYLGHEVSGIVAATGPEVTDLGVGDRVGVWVTERGYAEYVAVRADRCRPAGPGPLEEALAEPLACAANAVELADVRLDDDVVVVGAGFMGNLVQKLVQLKGPRTVTVIDTRTDALERARRLGATSAVDPREEYDLQADVAFEVTGVQPALETLGDVTRMGGKVVIVGFHQGGTRELPLGAWNWMAYDILNAHFRDVPTIMRGMRQGMRLLTSGRVTLGDLVTHRFALDEVNEAFAVAVEKPPGFVKATVTMES
jgi:2-desacetyl-2-hydroxyethyl bacteriochlorophyllide A dehydrogenase